MDRQARLIAGALLTIAVLGVIVWSADMARLQTAAAVIAREPALLLLFLVPYTVAFWLRALAWRSLLPELSGVSAFTILQAALFANHVLPIKGGEVLRPYLAYRKGAPLSSAAATTVVARLLDFVCLLAIAAVLLAFAPGSPLVGWQVAIAPVVTLTGGALLLMWLRSSGPMAWVPAR
ncbi:MAG: lysylphosphatidylglycerol synthase domain-containing protein, partial [Dehalococcoidia bacterium]